MMNVLKRILIFSSLCLLMCGCIRENRDDCGKLRLRFRYTHNNSDRDLLAEQVRDIRVYVFDQATGVLRHVIGAGPDDIARGYVDTEIPDGQYTFVSWGGGGDDLMRGYEAEARVGVTTLDDFRMTLGYDPAPGGKGGSGAVPRIPQFDDLFYAAAGDVTVTGGRDQVVDFDFIKNTSTLKVIVNGLEYLTRAVDNMPLDVYTVGRNFRYDGHNGLDNSVPSMLYEPYEGSADAGSQVVYIRQQRLSIAQGAGDRVTLYVRHAERDYDMVMPLDLVNAILQNPAYPDQDAIDREDLFVIELSILIDLKVTVTVNDWEIVILDPDIQ